MGKAALQAWREQRDAPRQRKRRLRPYKHRDWLHVLPPEPPRHQRPRYSNDGTTDLHEQIERLWAENDRLKCELMKVERLFRHATEYVLDKVKVLL